MSFWEKIGLPPRLVALCALLWIAGAPMIALAQNPNNPNAMTIQGPGATGDEGYVLDVQPSAGSRNFPVSILGVNCVTQCTSPWVVSGTVTANQGTAGASAWPVSAAQSGTWTVQQGSPPWSVSQGTTPWVGSRQIVKVSASFNRPANATAYTAKTAVSNSTTTPNVMTFSGAARVANGSGIIRSVIVTSNFNPTTTPDLVTWIFDASPTALKDDTALAFSAADTNHLVTFADPGAGTVTNTGAGALGNISSPLLGTQSGGSLYQAEIPFTVTDGTSNLYGVLETFTAFTPGSGETFTVTLVIEQE